MWQQSPDTDGDGDIDIAATTWRNPGRVAWFENLGDMRFVEHAIRIGDYPSPIDATGFNMDYADIDGDDYQDLADESFVWIYANPIYVLP